MVTGNENEGTAWGEHGGAEVSGKLNLAQDVTAPGNTGASVRWKSRHDCGPQYVLLTLRESRGIRQRRISRVPPSSPRRRQDFRRQELQLLRVFIFSHDATVADARTLKTRLISRCWKQSLFVRTLKGLQLP